MKEKRNYKRFELIPFLALLGCVGVLLFEGIFIFELYDRSPDSAAEPVAVQVAPVTNPPVLSRPPAPVPVIEKPAPDSSAVPEPVMVTPVPAEPVSLPVSVPVPEAPKQKPVVTPVG